MPVSSGPTGKDGSSCLKEKIDNSHFPGKEKVPQNPRGDGPGTA